MSDQPFGGRDDDVTPTGRSTPPERTSARPTPPSFKVTPKPARPSAPQLSPHPPAAELLDKANEAEIALRRPGWDKTDPGGFSTNAYVKRKARLYTFIGVAAAVGIQCVDHTLPLLFDLYERHLDRQAQRAEQKLEEQP